MRVSPNVNLSDANRVSDDHLLKELWRKERLLSTKQPQTLPQGLSALIAEDFISFDEGGEGLEKANIDEVLPDAEQDQYRLLWAKFGAANSCCMAYLVPGAGEAPSVCMSLWIERQGTWQKVFHHHNANYC